MAAPVRRRQPSRAAKLLTTATALKPVKLESKEQSLRGLKRSSSFDQTATPEKKPKTHIKNESSPGSLSPIPLASYDAKPKSKRIKDELNSIPLVAEDTKPPNALSSKKLLSYTKHAHRSPFPDFPRPTPEECALALRILSSLHGPRSRPKPSALKAPTNRAGCGNSPFVLDALVRTILSQNTSDINSSRAKQSMDAVYGRSDKWDAIVAGGQAKLEEAIRCGGLSVVKSRVILNLLEQVKSRYGDYTLEALRDVEDNDEVMGQLLSFKGVGPKTASCVMLFSLGRESFAVDTHVWRITGLLGWRPARATRDETHLHLDRRIPDQMKYKLHVLMITHGKRCAECKAGAVVPEGRGTCELRKAFEDIKQQKVLS